MTTPATLRAVEDVHGFDDPEAMRDLVTELRERAEQAEAEAHRLRLGLSQVVEMGHGMLLGTSPDNAWACSGLNMLVMRAERALEES